MLLLFKTNQMLSISAEIELPRASRATQNPCVIHPRASIWFQVDHDQNDKSFYLLTSKNDTSFFPSQTQPSFIKMTCCFYQSLKQSAFSVTRRSSSALKMTSCFDPVYLPPHRVHCARLCLCATCPVQTPTSRPSANLSLRGDAIIFCIYNNIFYIYFVFMLEYLTLCNYILRFRIYSFFFFFSYLHNCINMYSVPLYQPSTIIEKALLFSTLPIPYI